ncbi:MAG TPA: AI-2E family transporter [Vicinamibacterales bacterium]|nr:AI-2E family transporter [Vicinamibacterales bacterium]
MDRRALNLALAWGGLALLLYLVFLVIAPFLTPLGWAAVLAIVSYPFYARMTRRMPPGRAAALTTAGVTIVVIVPGVALTVAFVREALQIAANVQNAMADGRLAGIEQSWTHFATRIPFASQLDLPTVSTDVLRQSAAFVVARSGAIFQNVATFLIDLVLALFATFFLLRDGQEIMRAIRRLLPMPDDQREMLITRTRDLIWAGVLSSVAVSGLQGILGGIAFAIVGIEGPVFWGGLMAFFCLLPFGAWVVWLPAAIVLAVDGHMTRALILGGLGLGAVSTADNIVRPALFSGRVHINGLVIFVSLLGGLAVFGLLGIILGPVLVVTALSLLKSYTE